MNPPGSYKNIYNSCLCVKMLKQKFILDYSTQSFTLLFSIVSGVIIARFAGPTVLGTLVFGMSFVMMFNFLTDLGFHTAHMKLVSEGQDLGKCNATFTIIKIVTTSLFLSVIIVYLIVQNIFFQYQFESNAHLIVIIIWIINSIINSINYIYRTTFIAKVERVKVDLPSTAQTILARTMKIIFAALGFGAVILSLGNLLALLIIFPVNLYFFRKYPFSKFDKILVKKYITYAVPLFFFTMASSISVYIDRVLLQYFCDAQQVGFYSVGFSFSQPIRLFGIAVSGLFFPSFSKLVSEKNFDRINDIIYKYERLLILFVFPCVLLGIIYAPTFVPLILGKKYLASIPVVMIVIFSMSIYILQLPYGNLLGGMGKFKEIAYIQFINLLVLITSIYIMSSGVLFNLGATGASTGLMLSNIFLLIINIYLGKKFLCGLKYLRNIMPLVIEIVIAFALYCLYHQIMQNDLKILIYIYPFVFLIVMISVLTIFKIIKVKDWKNLIGILNIRDTLLYVKKELNEK